MPPSPLGVARRISHNPYGNGREAFGTWAKAPDGIELGDQPESETPRWCDDLLFGRGGTDKRRNSIAQLLPVDSEPVPPAVFGRRLEPQLDPSPVFPPVRQPVEVSGWDKPHAGEFNRPKIEECEKIENASARRDLIWEITRHAPQLVLAQPGAALDLDVDMAVATSRVDNEVLVIHVPSGLNVVSRPREEASTYALASNSATSPIRMAGNAILGERR